MSFHADSMEVGGEILQDANGVATTYTESGVAAQSATAVENRGENVRLFRGKLDQVRELTYTAADLTIGTWLHARITIVSSGVVYLADDRALDPGLITFKAVESTTGTLTPNGGSPVSIFGFWDAEDQADAFGPDGKRLTRRGTYSTSAANVTPAWTPDVLDKITIDGTAYAVERIEQTTPLAVLHMVEWEQRRIGGAASFRPRS